MRAFGSRRFCLSVLTTVLVALLSGCATGPSSGSFGSGELSAGSSGGGSSGGGSSGGGSSGGGSSGGGSEEYYLYIENYSSYDLCYTAICDCEFEACNESDIYVEPGQYTSWGPLPEMCVYVYVEDCDYGVYWEDYADMYDDYYFQLTD